ncbi:MAG: ABC transporter substrate-binding protein, partial [Rhizobiales bacterium]|nr:ABC transporter substrate-binding protein [Hyphomicrobiales bacterium]
MHRLEANRSPFPCNAAEFGCVSMRGLDADRRWGHRSRISKIKAFDLRMIRLRGQSSISIRNMSNPYAGQAGLGHVEAAKMAIEDAGGKIGDRPIEELSANHRHKTDVATTIVRHWIEVDGVDVIVDMPNSAAALATHQPFWLSATMSRSGRCPLEEVDDLVNRAVSIGARSFIPSGRRVFWCAIQNKTANSYIIEIT